MAGGQTFSGLWRLAGKALGGPGVNDRVKTALGSGKHLFGILEKIGPYTRREMPLDRDRGQILDFTAGFGPCSEPAIQDFHVSLAHHAEHPPDARRGEEIELVVDDDPVAIAEAQLAYTG